jgi:uncharacterized phiE125 gp8 family phage protein
MRVIVTPTALDGAPLDELKRWLSITTDREDGQLVDMMRASLAAFEAFTGLMPLAQACTERLPASRLSLRARTRPVRVLETVHLSGPGGAMLPVAADRYAERIDADGTLHLRLLDAPDGDSIELAFTAGLTDRWDSLDPGIRQGIVRLAAHHYRVRDAGEEAPAPPSSIAALWRPWRQVRL